MAGKPRDFVKLVADYYQDDRIMQLDDAAEVLFIRGLSWCAKSLTDGFMTGRQVAAMMHGRRRHLVSIRRLCDTGLWQEVSEGGGYRVTNWLKHNPSAEEILAGRARAAQRMQGARRPDVQKRVRANIRPEKKHVRELDVDVDVDVESNRTPSGSVRLDSAPVAGRGAGGAPPPAIVAEVKLELAARTAQRRTKLNKPPTVGNGRAEHVDFAATLAKLTEAAEKFNPSNSEGVE